MPTLHSAARYFEAGGSRTGIELHTPFDGTAGLFHNRPSRFSLGGGLDGQIVASEVVVTLGQAAGADERADVWTEQVSNYLGYVAHDVDVWRPGLRDQVRGWVARRRAEAEKHQEDLRSLGIPIRRRGDAPPVFREPAIVKRERPAAPPLGAGSTATGEPALSDTYFEHILFVIRAAGKAMERSPKTYEGWGEEDRRQVMILMLNTHYAGLVHAEAFNSDGKTDILIREEDKNVFIGECKFYDGPKTVTDTLKQIFGYTTWRDVKLAIIFFVDRKNASEAIKRIRDTVEGNAQFRAWLPVTDEPVTEFRARMAWPGDDGHLVTLHVSSFVTPMGGGEDPEEAPDTGS